MCTNPSYGLVRTSGNAMTYLHYSYGDRLLIGFDKGEMRRFIVVTYNSEVYTRAYC